MKTLSRQAPLAADHFRYYSGWATKIGAETLPVNMGGEWLADTTREPVGVVAQILPWNVLILMAAWKASPALAAGSTVILKPAETRRFQRCVWQKYATKPDCRMVC